MKNRRAHKKSKKRVGRGDGSGHGKTSCRGMKGQMSRSGAKRSPGFEGGQTTFIRRLPKVGFNNAAFKRNIHTINVDLLASIDAKEVTVEKLIACGIIARKSDGVKVLGRGKIEKPITVHAHHFSAKAKEKIEAAGGKAVLAV